ncbi:MAG: hypothetical protein U0893_05635 [Chloroflexota bacterium]
MIGSSATDSAAPLMRRGLLWLGILTSVGIVVELAVERHWTQGTQIIAWVALAVTLVALALAAWAASPNAVRVARILAVVVMVSALYGVWEHVESNYDAGELDREYGDRWESLPTSERWWLAVSKTVGPSPPLAPGALAQAALCALLATAGRSPSTDPRRDPA